ncbi:hypothetical protein AVEN_108321-1 [Araneus ventricosus]|uniref:Uncharacterized protein n=1 Tax=Araneus ventricosus TaxID=182803 RepID=A0A4Y2M3Y7_ARAVE|nr:hypothetical protein AVEN_108321-1 [Araneus ventricosus]
MSRCLSAGRSADGAPAPRRCAPPSSRRCPGHCTRHSPRTPGAELIPHTRAGRRSPRAACDERLECEAHNQTVVVLQDERQQH